MDIRELILQLRRSGSDRAVARASGIHRRTVKRYRQWASQPGLLAGALPGVAGLEALVQATLPEKPCHRWSRIGSRSASGVRKRWK